jgi:integrase
MRVSELICLKREDIIFGPGAYLRCLGKGRKHRCTPLRRDAVAALDAWLRTQPGSPTDPLFPGVRGHSLSRELCRAPSAADREILQRQRPPFGCGRHNSGLGMMSQVMPVQIDFSQLLPIDATVCARSRRLDPVGE